MSNKKIREILLGKALYPMKRETRHSMPLVAFLAWVGLGADGLSSSAYGPEGTFHALAGHNELGLYLAVATAVTVFIIALAYNRLAPCRLLSDGIHLFVVGEKSTSVWDIASRTAISELSDFPARLYDANRRTLVALQGSTLVECAFP